MMNVSFSRCMRQALFVCALLTTATTGFSAPKTLAPQDYYGDIAKKVARMLQVGHVRQLNFDDSISQKAWTNLITLFDPDRSYFLQSDLKSFDDMQLKIDDAIKSGDVSFAYRVHSRFCTRLEERYAFTTNLLAQGFSFTNTEVYVWKRKDAQWPASIEEQNDLWRKRIKNEYLAHILGKELDALNASNKLAQTRNATNTVAATTNTVVSTNSIASTSKTNAPAFKPEEIIAKRYKQYMIIFQDMDEEAVLQRYLSALCTAYDPHSDYLSPMRKEDFDIDMNLTLCGIGATLQSEDGMAKITALIPGGPAERDTRDIRLMQDDKIIGVAQGDGPVEDIVHWPLNKAVRKIRGAKGTKVVLEVIPATDPSGTTTKRVDLIRDEIKLEEQAATGRVERVTLSNKTTMAIGYVRLPAFYGTMDKRPNQEGFRSSTLDVAKILAEMNSENVEGLILDLRNNGGGSLREAIDLTGLFIRSGPAVLVREPSRLTALPVPNVDAAMAFRKPMIVMVNRTSASASEIVAGALQDYGRAIIVGDSQSHGKGTVQTVLPLGAEKLGSLKITTASFYRITGSSTQAKGITADIIIPSVLDGLDIGETKLPGALPWTQIESASYIPVADMTTFIPRLREASANRLANNPKYATYCTLVRHTKEISEQKDVPLEINARRQQMRSENELRKMEEAEMAEPLATGTGKKKSDDIVLDETMNILSDLVLMMGRGDIPMETEGDLRTRMMRIFGQ